MSKLCKSLGVRILLGRDNLVFSRSVKIKYFQRYSSTTSSVISNDYEGRTSYQSVEDFYYGKSVFITGGTGFLGKVFIEKLLYSCTKLDKIYILVRDKKGENSYTRIEHLFKNPLFTRLKTSNPDFMKKVVPVAGDITLPNLGLKPEDEQNLIDKVSVVFHAAATVNFNERLPVAMNINFKGTQKVLQLSQRMKNMEAFVYISTAYAHTQRKKLLETVYPAPAKVDDVYKFIEEYGHDKDETMKFISSKPNTYTFTKSLAEAYIASNCGELPTVIIRPSIVIATKDEPIKGWLDNCFGPTILLYSVAKGWNRISLGQSNNAIDLIPVDYVSNMSIVSATRARSRDVQVFNCTSSSENPIVWSDLYKHFTQEMLSRGKNELPYPAVMYARSRTLVNIGTFLMQVAPAHIADLWLKITGREAKYVKLLSQVVRFRNAMEFFTLNTWEMRAERARELYNSLSAEDKARFPCDVTQIEWSEYIRDYCKGVQRYLSARYTTKR